jgi:putative alpha-1,2-mannosidase
MRYLQPIILLATLSVICCTSPIRVHDNPLNYVDPFICTEGDNGMLYPGPAIPFGLVHLSPETEGDSHVGYYYEDDSIEGFSHTRIAGAGSKGKGGGLLIKPGIGLFTNQIEKFREPLVKSTEEARPGYYRVKLESGVNVELTTSDHVGFHRYTFPKDQRKNRYVAVDLSHSYVGMLDAKINIKSENVITGYFKSLHNSGGGYHTLYFAIVSDQPFETFTSWDGADCGKVNERQGKQIGVWLEYPENGKNQVCLKVGLSTVDEELAYEEAQNEIKGWDFDQAQKLCAGRWEKMLRKVEVIGGSEELKTIFYTHLYHSYLVPHLSSASNGDYRPLNQPNMVLNTKETAPDFTYYSAWSLWDDFRKYSLVSLLEPSYTRNIARSLVDYYAHKNKEGRDAKYSPTPHIRMEFNSTVVMDAWNKGIRDFDASIAYEGMKEYALNAEGERISDQLEHFYHAYVAMLMAKELGKEEDAEMFRIKALGYRNVWCATQKDREGTMRGFFTPAGKEVEDVEDFEKHVYEGHLWHYRWFVLHDVEGLASLREGKEQLAQDLEYFFENDLFMMVNEPDIHAPFLFNYLGKPWLTQKWARIFTTKEVTQRYHNHGLYETPVVSRIFRADTKGYIETMDDDAGAMASWFVMSAMGLFPSDPAMPYYLIGSPIFPEYRIQLEKGNVFTVKANNVSEDNFYIQSATLNGVEFDQCWISYDTIMSGGVLEFEMGNVPNKKWGKSGDIPSGMKETF